MANFDVEGARKAGYSDAEIADAMAARSGFNSASARKAGYQDGEIIAHLTTAKPPQTSPTPAQAQQAVADGTSTGESVLIGAGRTFDRIGKGVQQLYYGATGNDKELADLKARAADDDKSYEALSKAHPIATAVGESLPAMAIPVGGSATAVGAAAKMAVAAGGQSALEYGSAAERAQRAAGSAAGAVVGGVVVPKVAGVAVNGVKTALKGLAGNITPEGLALAARAKQLGIPVNVAQLGDSKFLKTLASSLEQVPFTGGSGKANDQRAAFTRAVSRTFGEDTSKLTPEVYDASKVRLGQQFDDLAARNNLNVTPVLQQKLAGIVAQAEATGSDDTIRAAKNIVGRVDEQSIKTGGAVPAQTSTILGPNGQPIITAPATNTPAAASIPGTAYSSIDSELSNLIKAGGEKGLYAQRLQSAVRDAMDASITPADKEAWDLAKSQYKNLKAVRDSIAKDAGGDGNIPPTTLMHALTSTQAGKEAMAMGKRGTLGELGHIGRQFVRDPIPNSGTVQRALAMAVIGGGGYTLGADPKTIAGMMVGGATAGRLINKVVWSPKTLEALSAKGLTIGELANMPPSRVAQIIGGITGMSAADQ